MTAKDTAIRMSFSEELSPAKIKVIGVGGGGCNAVNRMIRAKVEGIEFIAANTDLQALKLCQAPMKLQLGAKLTKGLGAGANPEVGRKAALEDTDKIIEALEGSDMIFITSGLGGGTGSGAAPVVASLASELGALTVAVVTKPFAFEGKRRMLQAEQALQDLIGAVDTVIVIPNERLMETVERGTSFFDAFRIADDILRQAVQGISDIITVPGIINRDFADVKAIMSGQGYAVMGTAVATGSNRAVDAANRAIASPLLEDNSIQGAQGILINICGSPSLTLHEVHEASSIIQKAAHENASRKPTRKTFRAARNFYPKPGKPAGSYPKLRQQLQQVPAHLPVRAQPRPFPTSSKPSSTRYNKTSATFRETSPATISTSQHFYVVKPKRYKSQLCMECGSRAAAFSVLAIVRLRLTIGWNVFSILPPSF